MHAIPNGINPARRSGASFRNQAGASFAAATRRFDSFAALFGAHATSWIVAGSVIGEPKAKRTASVAAQANSRMKARRRRLKRSAARRAYS